MCYVTVTSMTSVKQLSAGTDVLRHCDFIDLTVKQLSVGTDMLRHCDLNDLSQTAVSGH